MVSREALTAEQEAIVEHGDGPAVVIAVAGAGKTTALVHRIHRLVEGKDVPPDRILASSFNRATVQDLEDALSVLHLGAVQTYTFHALGLRVLRRAESMGLRASHPSSDLSPAAQARLLAQRALTEYAVEQDLDRSDLGISVRDLVDQVALWKQQLADPPSSDGTEREPTVGPIHTAEHDNDDYLALYRRFEKHRRQNGWLTYPDMVKEGLELLTQYPDLCTQVQKNFQYALVDEFQDVSRAQYHLLDRLTARHRNYMVIGDDDQCIYGWRGSDPRFLLDFQDHYDAREFLMTDSFRSPASALVLANAVIAKNETRRNKRLHLTQGFEGEVRRVTEETPAAVADQLRNTIDAFRNDGYSLNQIVVLVRTYGQTPPLERAFLTHDLPYRIVGRAPFYRRSEVQTPLRYLYWALLERRRRNEGWFERDRTADRYLDRFAHILNHPNRYVARERCERIVEDSRQQKISVLDAVAAHRSAMHDRTAERVDEFLDTAHALIDRLDDPPAETLEWLYETIDYESYLRDHSAEGRRAEGRVQTARSLIRYAENHPTSHALLQNLRSLARHQSESSNTETALEIRSIHRAKGAEWPVVIIPGCNEGTLPLDDAVEENEKNLEEERRLFYVALTRAQETLVLGHHTREAASRFLDEANVDAVLERCRTVKDALATKLDTLPNGDFASLCQNISVLQFTQYFKSWWAPSPETKSHLRNRLEAIAPKVEEARSEVEAYEEAREAYRSAQEDARSAGREEAQSLQARLGQAPIATTFEQPDTFLPNDAPLTFDWLSDEDRVGVFWENELVASLSPFGSSRLSPEDILSVPWPSMIGIFDHVARSRQALYVKIDWPSTTEQMAQTNAQSKEAPSPPSDLTQALTSRSFYRGYEALWNAVAPDRPLPLP